MYTKYGYCNNLRNAQRATRNAQRASAKTVRVGFAGLC
jgi:hypothetical protein